MKTPGKTGGFLLPLAFIDFAVRHGLVDICFGLGKVAAHKKSRIAPAFLLHARSYMCAIITSPKPEHDIWVAPSMSRAKS